MGITVLWLASAKKMVRLMSAIFLVNLIRFDVESIQSLRALWDIKCAGLHVDPILVIRMSVKSGVSISEDFYHHTAKQGRTT